MSINVISNEKPVAAAVAEKPAVEASSQPEPTLSAPEAKVPEQNESSESETEETESAETEPTDPQSNEPPKKKGGFQRRIDKLNARVSAKEQEVEFWKQQALKSASGAKTEPEVKPTVQTADEGKPKSDNFETHSEYVEALADWKTEQKLKERDQRAVKERLESEQSKIVSSYSERAKAFSGKTADFAEVLEEIDHIPLSAALRDIILNAENGPELAYELAKDPKEYERIAKLSPLATAREVGKLEYRLSSAKSSVVNDSKTITKAPKPIEPVGSGGKGSSATKSLYDSNLSQKEYEALRANQRAKKSS